MGQDGDSKDLRVQEFLKYAEEQSPKAALVTNIRRKRDSERGEI